MKKYPIPKNKANALSPLKGGSRGVILDSFLPHWGGISLWLMVGSLLLHLLSFSQAKPIASYRISNDTVPFGINLSIGSYIFNLGDSIPYQLTGSASSSASLNSTSNKSALVTDKHVSASDSTVFISKSLIVDKFIWQSGTGNSVFIGEDAGYSDDLTDNRNVYIGYKPGNENTSGFSNIAIGGLALFHNTSGFSNIAIGDFSLGSSTTSINNIAIGDRALNSLTTGQKNTSVGFRSTYQISTGSEIAAFGYQALFNNTTGDYTTAIGAVSLFQTSTGINNTALGYAAGYTNITGSNNLFLGYHAYPEANNQSNQIVIGSNALGNGSNTATIGDLNITDAYIGENGLATLQVGKIVQNGLGSSIFIGEEAGINDDHTTNRNVFIGYQSGKLNTSGQYNVALGSVTLFNNTTGVLNTAIGHSALTDNSIGQHNTAIGASASFQNTEGINNTAIGSGSLRANSIGSYNVAIGFNSLFTSLDSSNTAIGYYSGYSCMQGAGNIFIGNYAGYSETGDSTLYIDNTATSTPLIKGDFAADSITINGDITVTGLVTFTNNNVPNAYNASGKQGQIVYGEDYIYICIQDDEWKRVAISTW